MVGGCLAVLCVVLREVFFQLLPSERFAYPVSVFFAYFVCMLLNYWISGRFVYRVTGRNWREAIRFFIIAIGTSLLVSLLADALLTALLWLGLVRFIGAISLMMSALLLSLLSFSLNRKWVYRVGGKP